MEEPVNTTVCSMATPVTPSQHPAEHCRLRTTKTSSFLPSWTMRNISQTTTILPWNSIVSIPCSTSPTKARSKWSVSRLFLFQCGNAFSLFNTTTFQNPMRIAEVNLCQRMHCTSSPVKVFQISSQNSFETHSTIVICCLIALCAVLVIHGDKKIMF